jgi:hypothetical protein
MAAIKVESDSSDMCSSDPQEDRRSYRHRLSEHPLQTRFAIRGSFALFEYAESVRSFAGMFRLTARLETLERQ